MAIIIILIFCFLLAIVKNMIHYESKNIAFLTAVGYRNIIIFFILLIRLLIVNLFSYILTLIITIPLSLIINIYHLSFLKLISIDTLIMLVISLLILICLFIAKRKIVKLNVSDILQDS